LLRHRAAWKYSGVQVIRKIGLDAGGRIDRVEWQEADPQTNTWVGEPSIVPVADVVALLRDGVPVETVIPTDEGGTVPGPKLRVITYANGMTSIAAVGNSISLVNLPWIV
jgi:hypothetical protein